MNVSLLLLILSLCSFRLQAQTMEVISKVADVNAYPDKKERPDHRGFDRNRLSQVLRGDRVKALFVGRRWVKAKIPWMKILVNEKPASLIGWVEKRDLKKKSGKPGPALVKIRVKNIRESITAMAIECENFPYLWGGRSWCDPSLKNQKTSVDCSGFVSLVHQMHGIQIPKNTRTQYHFCKKIKFGSRLRPGDLIFLSDSGYIEGIDHVILYLGGGLIIQAVYKIDNLLVNRVIISSDVSYFGKPISKLASGDSVCGGRSHVFFGSFL